MNLQRALRRLLLALVGLTLPFEYFVLGSVLGLTVTPNKLLTALLLGYAVLQFATDRSRAPHDPKRPWVLVLGVTLTLSAVQAVLLDGPVPLILSDMSTWYALILFYLLLIYVVRSRRDLELLLGTFVAGCLVAAVSGWLGYGEEIYGARYGGERLVGEGGNPNLLAFNLLIATSISLSLYFTSRSLFKKLLLAGGILIMLVAITATASRSGIICVASLGLFWAARFRAALLRYAIPASAIVVAAAIFTPQSSLERLATLRDVRSEYSAAGRVTMWYDTARAFASNPVLGTGVGRYKMWAQSDENRRDVRGTGIHNAFLRVLAQAGLLGFVPFVSITLLSWLEFQRAWNASRRRAREDPELWTLALRAGMLQVGMFAILLMSMAQPSNQHKGLWMMFALSTVVMGLVRERVGQPLAATAASAEPWATASERPAPGVPGR